MSKKNVDISFEDAILKLEGIVSSLEAGNLSLNESINSFEEAIALVGICEQRLENARQKVKILKKSHDGTVTDAPFAEEADET